MEPKNTSFGAAKRLASRQAVDAVCDRFEAEWSAGRQPRLETYLELAPPDERPLLFRELLAIWLALGEPRDVNSARQEILASFPEFRKSTEQVFASYQPVSQTEAVVWPGVVRASLIHSVRTALGIPSNSPGRNTDSDGIHAESTLPTDFGPVTPARLTDDLWDLLIERAQQSDAAARASGEDSLPPPAAQVEAIVRSVLDTFPLLRRQILTSLLCGSSTQQAAARHGVTERTARMTGLAAIDLVASTGSRPQTD